MNKTAQLKFLPNICVPVKNDGTLILSCDDIEFHVQEFLKSQGPDYGYDLAIPQATPIDEIIEGMGLTIQYAYFADPQILGMNLFGRGRVKIRIQGQVKEIVYDAGTIIISGELEENSPVGRLNFTLAHEFGHSFYHEEYFNPHSENYELDFGEGFSCDLKASSCKRSIVGEYFGRPSNLDLDWVEWQADYFASCLLMPKDSVRVFMQKFFPDTKILFGLVAKDFPLSRCAEMQKQKIFDEFEKTYRVSHQAAVIRLRKLNYLK